MRTQKWVIPVIVLFMLWGFIFGYIVAEKRYEMPNCPTEDSCYPDYANGTWHIIPGQRSTEQYLFPN